MILRSGHATGTTLAMPGRRKLLLGSLAMLGGLGSAGTVAAALIATPRQTAGPFYPPDWSGDADWDLVRVTGEAARAQGRVTHLAGRVTDIGGAPIAGARVEIWQCDANGRYHHPGDAGRGRPLDRGFQGRGHAITDSGGGYRFRTIRPVPYPGRTPHIHFRVQAAGRPDLVTQMYVEGEPGNESDFLLRRIRDPRERAAVIVRLNPADRIETGALAGTFDIVMA